MEQLNVSDAEGSMAKRIVSFHEIKAAAIVG
jgi:hypothetical protein